MTEIYAMVICTFEQLKPTHARMAMGGFTPLKFSIRTADETSTKLPVTI
jgi:hypothetical protein